MSPVNNPKFCIKIKSDYFQDFVHRNYNGDLECDNIGTAFTSEELADVIVRVTRLLNNNGWFGSEIVVQLL